MNSSFGQNATLKTKRAHCAHLSVVLFNDRMVTNCPIDLLYIYSLTTKQDYVKRYAEVGEPLSVCLTTLHKAYIQEKRQSDFYIALPYYNFLDVTIPYLHKVYFQNLDFQVFLPYGQVCLSTFS